jgi:hypothetical protein
VHVILPFDALPEPHLLWTRCCGPYMRSCASCLQPQNRIMLVVPQRPFKKHPRQFLLHALKSNRSYHNKTSTLGRARWPSEGTTMPVDRKEVWVHYRPGKDILRRVYPRSGLELSVTNISSIL